MNTTEMDDLDAEPISWIEEVQAKAIEAAAGEISRACVPSLPVPARTSGGAKIVSVFLYPVAKAPEPGLNRVFEPDVAVALDAVRLEVSGIERLRTPADPGQETALGLDRNEEARDLPEMEWDSLQAEFYLLHEYLIDRYWNGDFDAEQKNIRRWNNLFRLLVPAGLRTFYHRIAPEFFARFESTIKESPGTGESASVEDRPGGGIRPSGGRALQLPASEIDSDIIESALHEIGLAPSPGSPLADLQPRPHQRGLASLLSRFPDSAPSDWRDLFQTLCAPEWTVEVAYGNEGFAAKTRFFRGAAGPRPFWVRLTTQPVESESDPGTKRSPAASYKISFPHDLDVIERMMAMGLKSKGVRAAEQIVHTVSLGEWAAIVAMADLWTEGSSFRLERMAEPIGAPALASMWRGLERSPMPTWCLTAAIAFPALLDAFEPLIARGLAALEAQQWLRRDSDGLKPAPKLRALIRSLQQPLAHASLQVLHHEANRVVVRGFTGVRTDRKLWIWEMAEPSEGEKPLETLQLNIFQVTHEQLAAILDRLLGSERSAPGAIPRST